jgi:hypothetical protein
MKKAYNIVNILRIGSFFKGAAITRSIGLPFSIWELSSYGATTRDELEPLLGDKVRIFFYWHETA